jgi:hypothetical protein
MVQCGTITVADPFNANRVGVPSGGCEITSTGPYQPGEDITLNVTVVNNNSQDAAADVLVFTNNQRLGSQTVQVPAGSNATATITVSLPDSAGDFQIQTGVTGASEL